MADGSTEPAPTDGFASGSTNGAAHDRVDALTRTLRFCGTLVLIGAVSSFMFGKWDGLDDVVKYLFLLLHTVMLFVAGIVAGAKVNDSRSARTFMLLTLGAVPINFAITGGLLRSQFALDAAVKLPQAVTWFAPTPLLALSVALGSLSVLAALSLLSTRALVRSHSKQATGALVGMSAALWLPVREPGWVAVVLLFLGASWLYTELRIWTRASCMRTLEGRLVRGALSLPVLLLAGRTLVYYGAGGIFVGALLMLVGFALFLMLGLRKDLANKRQPLDLMAAGVAAVGWLPMALELQARHGGQITPLWLVPSTIVIYSFSLFQTPARGLLRRFAAYPALAAALLTLPILVELSSTFAAIGIGVLVLTYAIWEQERTLALLASLTALAGLAGTVVLSVTFKAMFNWSALMVLGILLIFGAAWVEKKRSWFVRRAVHFRAELRQWRLSSENGQT